MHHESAFSMDASSIVYGPGTTREVGSHMQRLGATRVLVVTDPVVANAGVVHAPELVDWYNGSFYGKVTRMVPDDPFPG